MENTNNNGDKKINSTVIRNCLARIKTIKIIPHRNCIVTWGGNKILRRSTFILFSKSIKKYYEGINMSATQNHVHHDHKKQIKRNMARRNTRGGTPVPPANETGPTPTAQDDIRIIIEENEKLKEEKKLAEKQIVELQEKLRKRASAHRDGGLIHGYKGRGKNTVNLGDMLRNNPQNLVNYGNLSNMLTNKIFRRYKFMPKGWEMWSDKKNSMCCTICRCVTWPQGVTKSEDKAVYWKQQMVPMINKKIVTMKGNLTQQIKKAFQGKYVLL